jgi:hypothetical protein
MLSEFWKNHFFNLFAEQVMFTAVNGVDFEQWNWYGVKWISAARIQKLATSLPASSTFMASFSARDAQHQPYLCATQWLSLMHLVTMTSAAPITDLVNIQSIQQVSWRKFFSVMTLMLVALLIGSRHYTWIDYRGFKDICRLFSQYSKKIWASTVLNPSGDQTF